jgi:hypothetical protein
VALSSRRCARDTVAMGPSCGVRCAGRQGAHGLKCMSFQERSQSHSLMPAVDWVSVMKRKSQNLARRVGNARFTGGNSHRAHIARGLKVGVWPLPVGDMVWAVITFYMILARGVVADVRAPVRNGPGDRNIDVSCHGTSNATK